VAFEDTTNVENQWQGPIRTAPLDFELLRKRIDADFAKAPEGWSKRMAMTCLDQIDEESMDFRFLNGEKQITCPTRPYAQQIVKMQFQDMTDFLFLYDKTGGNWEMGVPIPTYKMMAAEALSLQSE
jgi:hypothetical protein